VTDLPLFPLGTLLLPHGRLPLQIFERRYIDMISKCMREGTRFGVVWIKKGSEVAQWPTSLTGINCLTGFWA
jgi:Lon protease-like protein